MTGQRSRCDWAAKGLRRGRKLWWQAIRLPFFTRESVPAGAPRRHSPHQVRTMRTPTCVPELRRQGQPRAPRLHPAVLVLHIHLQHLRRDPKRDGGQEREVCAAQQRVRRRWPNRTGSVATAVAACPRRCNGARLHVHASSCPRPAQASPGHLPRSRTQDPAPLHGRRRRTAAPASHSRGTGRTLFI